MPLAAVPVKPVAQTSSVVGGEAGGPHQRGLDCSAAADAGGDTLHIAPADFSHCSPAAAGYWPLPTAGQVHTEEDTWGN